MIRSLPWDSEHFGLPIGRVDGPGVTAIDVHDADERGLRCVYLLANAGDTGAIRAAEDLGFRLIDVRLTLSRSVRRTSTSDDLCVVGDSDGPVRQGVAADLPTLEPLARSAHSDSRFFSDPAFDREAAARLYARWLRSSVLEEFADLVLVGEAEGRAAGYITGSEVEGGSSLAIGLLAVTAEARGRGLGSRLLATFLRCAGDRGAEAVSVVTQGANVAAQRLYQKAGFRTIRSEIWLHRWAPGPGTHQD